MQIKYSDRVTEVRLGDYVRTKLFFLLPREGRVVYLPGVSQRHPQMEHGGLRWVGVKCTTGTLFGELVDPETGLLKKRLHFIRRGTEPFEPMQPDQKFDDLA
jgi:hypothetical protein